jgi:hypothetical protein
MREHLKTETGVVPKNGLSPRRWVKLVTETVLAL